MASNLAAGVTCEGVRWAACKGTMRRWQPCEFRAEPYEEPRSLGLSRGDHRSCTCRRARQASQTGEWHGGLHPLAAGRDTDSTGADDRGHTGIHTSRSKPGNSIYPRALTYRRKQSSKS